MIVYSGSDKLVKDAVETANKLLDGERGFYTSVANFKYEMTSCTSNQIVNALRNVHCKYDIKLKMFYHWNPFSKMKAVFNPRKPLQIKINKWQMRRVKHSIVGSIVHEYIHAVDNQYYHLEFGHGHNKSGGKSKTAPYMIGLISKNLSKAYYDS